MECALSARANNPSKKSKIELKAMKSRASSYFASKAMTQAIQPEKRFRQVTVFGILFLITFVIVTELFEFGDNRLVTGR